MINTINTSKRKSTVFELKCWEKSQALLREHSPWTEWFTAHSSSKFVSLPSHQVLHSCFSKHLNMPHILNSYLHEGGRFWGSIRGNQTHEQKKNISQHPLQDKNSSAEQLACYMHLLPTLPCPGVWQAKNHSMRLMQSSCSLLRVPT